MKRRINVLLEIEGKLYRFLKIASTAHDPSYYIYDYVLGENIPFVVADPVTLLKAKGRISTSGVPRHQIEESDYHHMALHRDRIYLKKNTREGTQEHLTAEARPQPFNKLGYRLISIFTPAPPTYLPIHSYSKQRDEDVIFHPERQYIPQINLYQLTAETKVKKMLASLPLVLESHLIPGDSSHLPIVLTLTKTDDFVGAPWLPTCSVFGSLVNKPQFTKQQLQQMLKINGLSFDISVLPDDAIITEVVYSE